MTDFRKHTPRKPAVRHLTPEEKAAFIRAHTPRQNEPKAKAGDSLAAGHGRPI